MRPPSSNLEISVDLAQSFDQYMKEYQELYEVLAQKTKRMLQPFSENLILVDVGTGPGLFSCALHHHIPSAVLIGIDSSSAMLQLAVRNTLKCTASQFVPIQAQTERLPLTDASVDCVVSRFCLLYWNTPEKGCQEIYRVLKPGGRLIIDSLNAEFSKWRLQRMLRRMHRQGASQSLICYQRDSYKKAYTKDQVVQLLCNAHYTILAAEGRKTDWKFFVIAEKPL